MPVARKRKTIQPLPIRARAFLTRIGWLGIAWTRRGLVAVAGPATHPGEVEVELRKDAARLTLLNDAPSSGLGWALEQKLRAYLDGERVSFEEPVDLSRTPPFTRRVLEATRAIPYGEVRTYGGLAAQVGSPRAARAVGQAMAANPMPLVVPCHRVVASSGKLGGYGLGVELKERLLDMERRTTRRTGV